jgi:hypothetical protein
VKIRWRKNESGRYSSSDGRFVIVRNAPLGYNREEWIIYDGEHIVSAPESLRAAKLVVDGILSKEAENA